MKQHWTKLAAKIDALSLRERSIIFVMAALALVMAFNALLLDPQYAKQKQLSERIRLEQAQMASMQAEIQLKTSGRQFDPDKENQARLQQLRQQFAQMQTSLEGVQKGLVSPDHMSALLEDILKRHGKLRLLSLKTLPASPLNEPILDEKKTAGENASPQSPKLAKDKPESKPNVADLVYRHGVEIVVQGSYLDMLDYLTQLEAMPWQLFWGKAALDASTYSKATLTLTLYTLSLDKKWLNI